MSTNQPMKTLGLIGGTSWHSTIEYYRFINQAVNDHFGDNTNPPLVLFNLNQSLVHQLQVQDDWQGIEALIVDAGKRLADAGAAAVMCCANTPHKVFEAAEQQLSVPMLHIADATARAIGKKGLSAVGFIGTKFSMNEKFVTARIAKHGIDVLVPGSIGEREELHRIIQKELTFGQINAESKQYVLDATQSMLNRGAEGVVLGCTEFPLMLTQQDLAVPIFNTTEIHAQAAVDFVLTGTH